MHAPIGGAQVQAERVVGELQKTGDIGYREAERVLHELRGAREKAQARAQQEADRLDRFIESRIEDILNRVNIPSRSDIERLNSSVDHLTAKVEALLSREQTKARARPGSGGRSQV
jgi:poly(hydroxyalkanoate) granule-associated protein